MTRADDLRRLRLAQAKVDEAWRWAAQFARPHGTLTGTSAVPHSVYDALQKECAEYNRIRDEIRWSYL